MIEAHNPIIGMDFPDPDVIRVDGTFYMVTTTMHMFPGCEILRSYDLVNWEHLTYVYDTLDSTEAQKMEGDKNIFGKGMWAASLRYHKGIFYIVFVANDTGKTYLYRSSSITGPWDKSLIDGFYHDSSLLFDDSGRVFIAYGNTDIYLTELNDDLSAPKEGGLHRLIVSDKGNKMLGFEGSHLYKINGYYYLFLIHSASDKWMRREACFYSDSLTGEFVGGDVLSDDLGRPPMGAAQGGIVDDTDGNRWSVVFRDCGAIGRIPVVVPVTWDGIKPVFGADNKVPIDFKMKSTREEYDYTPLYGSDDFKDCHWKDENGYDKTKFGSFGLKSIWQFSHEPKLSLIDVDKENGFLTVSTDKLSVNIHEARNVLTQRTKAPTCSASVTVDGSLLKEGDYAGLAIYQGNYIWAGLTRRDGRLFVVLTTFTSKENTWIVSKDEGEERCMIPIDGNTVRLRMDASFSKEGDYAWASWGECDSKVSDTEDKTIKKDCEMHEFGIKHPLSFRLDYFCGARFGLFIYSTKETGGSAKFSDFIYSTD